MRLVIAGDGEQAAEIRALAQELCPAGTVCFAGWVSDTDSFYQALDVNLLTSLSETFPYALTEGARMRCATIASRVGGIPYLIDEQINGLLFPARDVQALADCMVQLACDSDLRHRMADALHEKVRTQFSVEATVARQEKIYARILRQFPRRQRKRDGVLLCGAYGKHNAGDDAILRAIVGQLHEIDEDLPVYALSRTPKETRIRYRVGACHTFNFFRFLQIMRHTRLYISGGGTLIQNVTSSRSLLYYLTNIGCAHAMGNHVMMYGCGIGPVTGKLSRRMSARCIDRCVDTVTLRDHASLEELRAMGVSNPQIHLTADPALLLSACPAEKARPVLLRHGLEDGERYVMFVPRPWHKFADHVADFAAAAQYVYEQHGMTPVFFALEPERDEKAVEQIVQGIACPCVRIRAPQDSGQILALMQRMEVVVSMRLHALIFAAGQGVPLVGIVYDPKVSGFLDDLGQTNYALLDDVTAQTLQQMIDRALSDTEMARKNIAQLQQLARENELFARKALEA